MPLAVLSVVDKSQNALAPAGPQAQHISDLFYIILIPALLVLVLVGGAIIYAAFKFRRKSEDEMPRQIGGSNALEFTWTIVPALILLAIFGVSLSQLPFLRHTPTEAANAFHVHVIGRQWAWSFEYPGGVKTFGTLNIPAGEVVQLDIDSVDVIHSWSVPRLGGRLDAVPGMQNHTWIEAFNPGNYYGQCTEFCGTGHASMTVTVVALPSDQFDSWYQTEKKKVGGA